MWQDLRAESPLVRVVITLRVMKHDLAERDHYDADLAHCARSKAETKISQNLPPGDLAAPRFLVPNKSLDTAPGVGYAGC